MELKRAKVMELPTKDRYKGIFSHARGWRHLYITTDDEIKEGDWFYNGFNDNQPKIQQRKGRFRTCFNQHKIIATTDSKLTQTEVCNYTDEIIIEGLPSPSQAFVEKYCELGGIDEVDVELETFIDTEAFNDLLKDPYYKQFPEELPNCVFNNRPKTNSNNEIAIHSIKNSWNREEVEALLFKFMNRPIEILDNRRQQSLEDWINENL